ncbi:hypothetical protein [Aulosira sp. FACHB-615]|uniref:hypothetical protein n=1 Tax=Aulosira sp. FACHB-615 TaxID=2692777 RepID=UPI0016868A04|nr:hypothetical protein [Aulosira sp. FACHB-615]MBD2490793.1 hypothetical protein [Aulosira sp. FACHB-615]
MPLANLPLSFIAIARQYGRSLFCRGRCDRLFLCCGSAIALLLIQLGRSPECLPLKMRSHIVLK